MKKKIITSKAELDEYIKEKIENDKVEIEKEIAKTELEINRIENEIKRIKGEIELVNNLPTFEFEEWELDIWELDKNERIVLNINKRNGTANAVNNLC
jgi:hypothetical protein